jgi:DNA repair protein RadC
MHQLTNYDLLSVLLGNQMSRSLMQDGLTPIFQVADGFIESSSQSHRGSGDKVDDVYDRAIQSPFGKLAAAKILIQRLLAETMAAGTPITTPAMMKDYLKLALGNLEHEVFYAVWLNASNGVIQGEELFRGSVTQTSVYPREVVKRALQVNAVGVVFCHNHPSGVAEPSRPDKTLTKILIEALALVEVKVLDHIIVGRCEVRSMSEMGLI